MKNITKIVLVLIASVMLANCSGTYKVKPDMNTSGVVSKTPKWYVKYDRETMLKYQESGTAVSPDIELAVKKAVLLAKAKLIDRVSGEMNNQTTITKTESGEDENLTVTTGAEDIIMNQIQSTIAEGYVVTKSEIFMTKNRSYRAYILLEIKKSKLNI